MSAGNVLMGYYTYPGDRVDVGDFCRLIADASDLPQGLKTAARALRESLASATLAHSNKGADNSTGLTLALPLYRTEAKAAPEEVALWQATGWDRVIERFQVQDAEKCRPPAFPLFFQN